MITNNIIACIIVNSKYNFIYFAYNTLSLLIICGAYSVREEKVADCESLTGLGFESIYTLASLVNCVRALNKVLF